MLSTHKLKQNGVLDVTIVSVYNERDSVTHKVNKAKKKPTSWTCLVRIGTDLHDCQLVQLKQC